jgi:regulator of RNase E activity RraA
MAERPPLPLGSSLAADCLDRLGIAGRVLDERIAPLAPGMRVDGPAHTLDVAEEPGDPGDPYAGEVAAVDAIPAGAVVVTSRFDGAAIWGELLATAATARGGVGIVTDGPVRDLERLRAMGFATFHAGRSPLDSQGRLSVRAHGVPVRCGGVEVAPGDRIVADDDGAVAIPAAAVPDVLALAAEKDRGEGDVRAALRGGESLRVVFDRHRIL